MCVCDENQAGAGLGCSQERVLVRREPGDGKCLAERRPDLRRSAVVRNHDRAERLPEDGAQRPHILRRDLSQPGEADTVVALGQGSCGLKMRMSRFAIIC